MARTVSTSEFSTTAGSSRCRALCLRLVADGVHALVRALAPGLLLDLLDRVALGEVDRDRADLLGLRQALGDPVDDEDLRGAAQQRRVGGHQPDRTAAVHRDALAGRDLGEFAAVVAGREDVGEQDEVGLVLGPRRQLQAVEVGEGNAQVLGLAARLRAHRDVAVGAAGEARVHGQAEARVARHAVLAEAAGDIEGHDDAVALLGWR